MELWPPQVCLCISHRPLSPLCFGRKQLFIPSILFVGLFRFLRRQTLPCISICFFFYFLSCVIIMHAYCKMCDHATALNFHGSMELWCRKIPMSSIIGLRSSVDTPHYTRILHELFRLECFSGVFN
uniref:Uncharacterized protein n=1 Tax=Arundo donax TaxID=35708 RepID=A0A0A9E2H9_ARUDO